MKKLILSMALLAGMTFVACSSDDDSSNSTPIAECMTCTFTAQGTSAEVEMEFCEEDYDSAAEYEAAINNIENNLQGDCVASQN